MAVNKKIGKGIFNNIEEFVEEMDYMEEYEEFLLHKGDYRDVVNKDDLTQEFLNNVEKEILFVTHAYGEGIIIIL